MTGEPDPMARADDVEVHEVDPESADAEHCLQRYFAEIDERMPTGFDLARSLDNPAASMRRPAGFFLVARRHGDLVGCGAVKLHDEAMAELKRMWVAPAARGLGLGRRLLRELEDRAAAAGARRVQLDSNASLVEAIALYRASGYREVPAFNDEPHADLWFEKPLPR